MRLDTIRLVRSSVLVLALTVPACAVRAPTTIQDAAQVIGEAALALDAAERDAFASGLYDAAKHQAIGQAVLRALRGARAFERAVAAGDAVGPPRLELLGALDDVAAAAAGGPAIQAAVFTIRRVLQE